MEDLPEKEEISGDSPSPMEILDEICEEMKSLLTSAETLLHDQDDSIPKAPEPEEA
jgi:hypothetical protein